MIFAGLSPHNKSVIKGLNEKVNIDRLLER